MRGVPRLLEVGGKRLPFLRWSVLRLALGRSLNQPGPVGDGRERALAEYVCAHARAGDIDGAIASIDEFAYGQSFLINIGDEKGEILDAAVRKAAPSIALELGTYCGYSALRIARCLPSGGRLVSVEFSAANASIARRIWQHAGAADRIAVVVGSIGDGGATLERLQDECGFAPGSLDFVFLDHAKEAYLPDLELILERGWLHPGSIVVADNVKLPGAPEYRAYMRAQEGRIWRTIEHQTHAEYQTLLKDVVLESEYHGG
jgi:catechol O-methyltransferase